MSVRNPSDKSCWRACSACFKCEDKGRYASCVTCSGRHDPKGRFVPDSRVYCDCKNGVLRHMTQEGRLIVTAFKQDPFSAGGVSVAHQTQDERDWESYLQQTREALDDPYWDPIKYDG